MTVLWVSLGGAVGSAARYLMSGWMLARLGATFPYGTLAVNLLGSFALALLMRVGVETTLLAPNVRFALTAGVMGGFTTYSTFSYETMQLLQGGATVLALGNVVATLVGGLVACALGWFAAVFVVGAP